MQIIGYPGDRVDFVSRSGSAGSILFGDPRCLVEEFFGPAHTEATDKAESAAPDQPAETTELTYYSGAVRISLAAGRVRAISVYPQDSREKMQVQVGKNPVRDFVAADTGIESATAANSATAAAGRVHVVFGTENQELESVTFSA